MRGRPAPKRPGPALVVLLRANDRFHFFPLDPERADWTACSQTACPGQSVTGERVAELDVAGVVAFDDHVGLADGVGFRVELLAEDFQAGIDR